MKAAYVYLIAILLLLGCGNETRVHPSTDLEKYILDLPKVEVSQTTAKINRDQVTSILSNIENSIPDKVIFVDYNDWSIHLAKKDGTLLDKKGGAGKGPGEFEGINDLYTYVEENMLQVYDKKLDRLTYYSITGDSLKFSHTTQFPNYDQSYLQNVYENDGQMIGVFRVLRQFGKNEIENKLYVYTLDEELRKKEKILEIEGSELIEMRGLNGDARYRENLFGNETVWSFADNKLFYANSENLNFNVYDFETKNLSEYTFSNIPLYENTKEVTELMTDRYSRIFGINPEYEDYFKEREKLPYFSDIYARNKYLYVPLRNYGDEIGYILQFNIESAEMKRIETPPNFFMEGINQLGIYGVGVENDYYGNITISFLDFE